MEESSHFSPTMCYLLKTYLFFILFTSVILQRDGTRYFINKIFDNITHFKWRNILLFILLILLNRPSKRSLGPLRT